jgi:hypothetical protein
MARSLTKMAQFGLFGKIKNIDIGKKQKLNSAKKCVGTGWN